MSSAHFEKVRRKTNQKKFDEGVEKFASSVRSMNSSGDELSLRDAQNNNSQESLRFFRLNISYSGKNFSGFQRQLGQRTVQEEIEKALFALTQKNISIEVAGRTDAGVHAKGQAASFVLKTRLTLRSITLALAQYLPTDISVWRVDEFRQAFSARHQSVGKRYVYRICQSLVPNILLRDRAWHVRRPLDIALMNKAAGHLVGEKDFESFRAKACVAANAWRFIWLIDIRKIDNELIEIDIRGNAFCQNMVRIIVGTLVEVGLKKRAPDSMVEILLQRKRESAGVTAKAQGLSLEEVYYPDNLSQSLIPSNAKFKRYPVSEESWPHSHDEIIHGPM